MTASRPSTSWAVENTFSTPNALFRITVRTIFLNSECTSRFFFAKFDAGTATYTPFWFQMRFGHAHNSKIMHPNLCAIIWATREGNLEMQIVWVYCLFNSLRKFRCIIAGIGTNPTSDAGGNITGSGRWISFSLLCLVDTKSFDQRLKHFVYLPHVLKTDSRQFKTLTAGNMDSSVSVGLRNGLNHG